MATLNVTAEQAAQEVRRVNRQQRTMRRLPTLPPNLERFSKETQVYIFNVGPWEHNVMLGSWGTYHIPACEKGKAYAAAPPVPGIFTEPIPINEKQFALENIEGSYYAEQVLGVGRNMAWNTSLVKLGVFMSSKPIPDKRELDEAHNLLQQEFIRLLEEAEVAFSQGAKVFADTVDEKHKIAARELGRTDVRWMQSAQQGQRQACPNCGVYSEPQVVSCPNCTYIFDQDRYNQLKGRLASARRQPGQ